MKKIILICLLSIAYSSEGFNCPTYGCNPSAKPCLTIQDEKVRYHYKVNSCPEGEYCNFDFNTEESSCTNKSLNERFPGEYCKDNDDCLSRSCKDSKCVNITHDGSCHNHADCSLEHFCHSGTKKCTKVKSFDEKCNKGDMCAVGLACNDKCVPMFSIGKGDNSTSSAACETFFAINGTCVEGPRLEPTSFGERNNISEGPVPCAKHCPYIAADKFNIQSSCVCGMDPDGKKYCNPGLGEIDINDVYFIQLLV